jgi:RND family efflux transporter MFP subunit
MQKISNAGYLAVILLLASCGTSTMSKTDDLATKKSQLAKLKQEQAKLGSDIQKLEGEIALIDTTVVKKENRKLVSLDTLSPKSFTHFIDLQGKIDARDIAYVSPRGGPGQVKELFVKKGDVVKKGQLLLKLDDALIQRQTAQLEPQLENAKTIYQKQKNLWDQQIGTEVQLLNYKTQMESLERQMALLNEQLSFTNVYAEISGAVEEVNVRVGEMFTGATQIKIVNTNNLKALVQVPENYLDKVKVGSNVQVVLPEINNKTIVTKVSATGKLIDANSRSFWVEANIPDDKDFHPNQVAIVKIQDYSASNTIIVPVNTLQTDEHGKYVLVAVRDGDRVIARKKPVQIGQLYHDQIEIKSGLNSGDAIIKEGFQGLYDGQAITTNG